MELLISAYISSQILDKPGFSLKNDTPLLESRILNSLSLLKLVVYLEKEFGIVVPADELVPENFKTIDAICNYLQSKSSHKISDATPAFG